MTQEAVVVEEKKSKTQELRDWLDGQINRWLEGLELLTRALKVGDSIYPQDGRDVEMYKARYGSLMPDERDVKMAEDRKKLEELEKRLELLRSARELDVDVDALEDLVFDVKVWKGVDVATPYVRIRATKKSWDDSSPAIEFTFDLQSRHVRLIWNLTCGGKTFVADHYLRDVAKFQVNITSVTWYCLTRDPDTIYYLGVSFPNDSKVCSGYTTKRFLDSLK